MAMANQGPMPQADLLALYRRLFVATRALEAAGSRRGRPATTEAAAGPGGFGGALAAAIGTLPRGFGRGSRRRRRAISISATSRTRSSCGAWRGRRGGG